MELLLPTTIIETLSKILVDLIVFIINISYVWDKIKFNFIFYVLRYFSNFFDMYGSIFNIQYLYI